MNKKILLFLILIFLTGCVNSSDLASYSKPINYGDASEYTLCLIANDDKIYKNTMECESDNLEKGFMTKTLNCYDSNARMFCGGLK